MSFLNGWSYNNEHGGKLKLFHQALRKNDKKGLILQKEMTECARRPLCLHQQTTSNFLKMTSNDKRESLKKDEVFGK